MKSAFAAGVGILSPAGRSRLSAEDWAANPRVWSARRRVASGCPWSGLWWIGPSSKRVIRLQQINRWTPRPHRPGLAARRAQRSPSISLGSYACRTDIYRATLVTGKHAFFVSPIERPPIRGRLDARRRNFLYGGRRSKTSIPSAWSAFRRWRSVCLRHCLMFPANRFAGETETQDRFSDHAQIWLQAAF